MRIGVGDIESGGQESQRDAVAGTRALGLRLFQREERAPSDHFAALAHD